MRSALDFLIITKLDSKLKKKKGLFSSACSGFSIIEILIALFVFSVIIASVFVVSFGNQTILMNLKIYRDLLSISQLNLERAKDQVRYNFNELESREEVVEGIENKLEVSWFYDYTKKIKSKIRNLKTNLREVELPLYVSNLTEALGGDTCFRNFENLEDYEILQDFSLGVINPVTDLDVVRGKVYITIDSITSPNFLVVDVSNINNPEFISNNFDTNRRLVSLHVVGKYVFLATQSTARQLQVLNIENPENPQLLSEFRLPNPSSTTTQSSMFYKDEKIYLGSEKNNWGKEFHVIDVENPPNPQYLGGFRVDTKVNAVAIKNDFTFIAVPNPFPLRMLDTGNYQNIQSIY